MPAVPLLRIEHLKKSFDGLQALLDVSLAVVPGQIKGLIGPNGAGKTTLFNLVAGVLAPSAGDIRFRGRSILGHPPYQIAELGIVRTFQNVQIFPGMTVLENVLVGCHQHMRSSVLDAAFRTPRMRREEVVMRGRAAGLLAMCGLDRWADASADSLPFGLQRIVEIARALAASPTLLLLDEPGAGLSATEKSAAAALIRRIRDEGLTVFLVEHDMALMMDLADEVAVLDRGVLIAEGPPAAIQANIAVITAYLGVGDAS